MSENLYPQLSPKFLEAMNDIGQHGFDKHGENSFQAHIAKGDRSRWMPRVETAHIGAHIADHFQAHNLHIKHDHFKTRRHQLAAVAFNAMLEYYLSGLEDEV